jgi:hypothetical protein
MASKKKWLGMAALFAIAVAFVKRKKRDGHGDSVNGSIET